MSARPRGERRRNRGGAPPELRDHLALARHLAERLHDQLAEIESELDAARSSPTWALRDEHGRQAYWLCQAAFSQATGIAEDADEIATGLSEAFEAPDPRLHPDSRWWSPSADPSDGPSAFS